MSAPAKKAERRLIIEVFDPRVPMVGGVDTCIRGLLKYHPDTVQLAVIGLDVVGGAELGKWMTVEIDGRPVKFMPVYHGDNSVIRPRLPHALRLMLGTLRYAFLRTRSDTVQTHRLSVGFAVRAMFPGRPHVQFVHNDGQDSLTTGSESYFSKAIWLFRFLERRAVRKSLDVVVFNQEATDRLSAHGDNVRFSTTWYDEEKFFPEPAPRENDGPTSIAWLARFEPPKDPLLAVRAMTHLDDSHHLTMMGGGSLLDDAKDLAAELKVEDRITFAGPVAKDSVGEALRTFDALLMTSFHEGFPRAVVESLATGLPVVTTEGGEPNGLVQTGLNGARSGREPEQIAEAIRSIDGVDRDACRESVRDLSAGRLVPVVLDAGFHPKR